MKKFLLKPGKQGKGIDNYILIGLFLFLITLIGNLFLWTTNGICGATWKFYVIFIILLSSVVASLWLKNKNLFAFANLIALCFVLAIAISNNIKLNIGLLSEDKDIEVQQEQPAEEPQKAENEWEEIISNYSYEKIMEGLDKKGFIPESELEQEEKEEPARKEKPVEKNKNRGNNEKLLNFVFKNEKKYYPLLKQNFLDSKGIVVIDDGKKLRIYGRASWYGTDFQGRTMAYPQNGKMPLFDKDDPKITASCIIPAQSKLKVTNLTNKKSITVWVRDAGPYDQDKQLNINTRPDGSYDPKDGFVLDLSEAAAKKLDFYKQGIAFVKVEFED